MEDQWSDHSFRKAPVIRVVAAAIIILAVCSGWVSGGVFLSNGSDVTGDDTLGTILADRNATPGDCSIEFFYNTHCGACHVAMAYLNEYTAAHPDIIISSHDLFNSSENKALFEQYKTAFNRSYVSVPSVFIGNAGLEGESAIRENFEPLVSHFCKKQNVSAQSSEPVADIQVNAHRTVISIPLVLIAGIIDGINPCAVAVLIFLLVLLMTIRERQRIILVGTVFTTAVFFFYFISGTGLYSIANTSGFVRALSLIVGVLATLIAIMFFLEAIFPKKTEGVLISDTRKGEITSRWKRMAIPVAFISGLILGVLELPCAGGIYITILDMISFRVNIAQGLVYLILYNLAFIIPLVLMTIIAYLAIRSADTDMEQGLERSRGVKFFIGLLLLAFAFLVLAG